MKTNVLSRPDGIGLKVAAVLLGGVSKRRLDAGAVRLASSEGWRTQQRGSTGSVLTR